MLPRFEKLPARIESPQWRGEEAIGGTVEANARSRLPAKMPGHGSGGRTVLKIGAPTPVAGAHFIWDYAATRHAFAGAAQQGSAIKARNRIERSNTPTFASGYDLTESGDCPITGVAPVPATIYVEAWGPIEFGGQWIWEFEFPNIAIIDEGGGGSGVMTIDGGSP